MSRAGAAQAAAVAWERRDVAIRDAGGSPVFEARGVEAPRAWSDLAVAVVARRYFLGGPQPESSVRALVDRVVGALGAWAVASGHLPAGEAAAFEADLAALVLGQRATFATPVWLNAGTVERPLTAACFILSVDDSMRSLLDWNTEEGLIFQQGAGCGVNLSRVRSSREPVTRGGLASGPLSFMRGADAWAATIRSGGRARRAAKMVVLDADHPDLLDFIGSKQREEERGRALAAAGWPPPAAEGALAFQQSNHAVRVTDAFMRAATAGGDWELRAVTTGEPVERLPAADVLRACAEANWACGDPGLQFADAIDRWHTTPSAGPITASNPCGEYLSVDDSACNLATLNLLRFALPGGGFDVAAFVAAVEAMVLAQDVLVSGSGYPTPAIERNARRLRQIGLGYSNLAALLLSLGLPYDSDGARGWAAAVTGLMTGAAYRRSAALAAALGPFEQFAADRKPMLAVVERHRAALEQVPAGAPAQVLEAAAAAFDEALGSARDHGFRNAQVTLVAPTGTVSLMMDCETTGIEPYLSLATVKRFADGGQARLTSRMVAPALRGLGYGAAEVEALQAHADAHGSLAGATALAPQHGEVFRTALGPDPIAPGGHLRMVAAVQPLVSGAVSKTVNLPAGATVQDVEALFVEAWRLGLKAVAVYREGSKLVQPLQGVD